MKLLLALLLPFAALAQPWSGVIDSTRAVDWSTAGVIGGIPSGSWPNCTSGQAGTSVPIAAYSGSAAAINTALANCAAAVPSGSVLVLAAGTFTISSGIDMSTLSHVALRGQGADSTIMLFSGDTFCGGANAFICVSAPASAPTGEGNVCDWTAGYTAGSTTISMANCGSTTPAVGALGNLKIGGIMALDQVDPLADTGHVWHCVNGPCTNEGSGGIVRNDGPCVSGICYRSQVQYVQVTNCTNTGGVCTSGSNITISPPIFEAYASAQKPQTWYPSTVNVTTYVGVENLSVSPITTCDSNNANPGTGSNPCAITSHDFTISSAINCWIKGVRGLWSNRAIVGLLWELHDTVQDSYFYGSIGHGSGSYGIETILADSNLISNNVLQQMTDSSPTLNAVGTVVAYNYAINSTFGGAGSQFFQASFYLHAGSDSYNLWEGNIGSGFNADTVHGTHHFETLFRNYLKGWQLFCGQPQVNNCTQQTTPFNLGAGSRYFNLVGNVIGTTGYHDTYQCLAASTATCSAASTAAYVMGYTGEINGTAIGGANPLAFCTTPSCSARADYDPQTVSYVMRWGNWDVVNAATQWNSGEVPSGISPFANAVPTTHNLSSSFYLSGKPSWFGANPYPVIGPDVTGGTLGVCSGGTYAKEPALTSAQCTGGSLVAGLGGLANANPAMVCALNIMTMPPDGSGSQLSFNANTCYGASAPTVTSTAASAITLTTATAGGNVTAAGSDAVTARGTCYGTSANPTTPCTSDGSGTGVFTSSLVGLTPLTTYHIRAFATSIIGTSYGSDLTFTTASNINTITRKGPRNQKGPEKTR